jgi:hypothetical protein
MKKSVATIICLIVISIAAIPAGAQTRARSFNNGSGNDQRYDNRNRNDVYRGTQYRNDVYRNDQYRNNDYRYNNDRAVWDSHRDKLTTAGGAVAGALLGGLVGGKKGAIIGALAGGGGGALYTYKIRN